MTGCYEYDGVRYLHARHNDGCDGTDCAGCQQCGERHCPECRKGTHLAWGENTCPTCIAKARTALRDIVDLAAALPAEAAEKGVDSEAFNLNGPAADVEAFAWRRAARSNREGLLLSDLAAADPTQADDEHHPRAVLQRIVLALCEDYGDDYRGGDTIAELVDWIDARLGRIAHDAGQDFGQFRREVGRCRGHLEAVLHAGEQDDTGAPCMTCRVPLRRVWGGTEAEDRWWCPRCRETSTDAQYRLVVKHAHRAEAEWLTQEEMQARTAVPPATLRSWARREQVRKRDDGDGRKVYSVADVEARMKRAAS